MNLVKKYLPDWKSRILSLSILLVMMAIIFGVSQATLAYKELKLQKVQAEQSLTERTGDYLTLRKEYSTLADDTTKLSTEKKQLQSEKATLEKQKAQTEEKMNQEVDRLKKLLRTLEQE